MAQCHVDIGYRAPVDDGAEPCKARIGSRSFEYRQPEPPKRRLENGRRKIPSDNAPQPFAGRARVAQQVEHGLAELGVGEANGVFDHILLAGEIVMDDPLGNSCPTRDAGYGERLEAMLSRGLICSPPKLFPAACADINSAPHRLLP